MAGEMPKTVRLIGDNGTLKFPVGHLGSEYIRADLAVLATTHQRTLEALREAEKALRLAEDDLFAGKNTPGTYPAVLAALARIKEAT